MLLNVTEIGSPTVDNGVVSGFSSANYLKITDSFDVSAAQSWEVVYKIKTGTNITTGQSMCGHTGSSNYDPFTIDINSSKFQLGLCKSSSSNLLKDQKGTYTVLVDTTYWLKLTFDGSKYALSYSLDGVDFIEDVVFESTTKIWTSNLVLGRQQGDASEYQFLGSIDLNECYIKINGELWWTGMVEGGIKPVRSYVFKRRETTKDDYDVVKTEDSFYSLIRPKIVVLKNWNQPVLSANDGHDNFSVTHINIATLADYQAYKAFDYNNSTEWRSGNNPDLRNGTILAGLRMRFGNTPVNITSLEFTNSTKTPISPVGTFDVYGCPSLTSNERVLLMRYDNTTTSSGTSWSVDLSDNKGFYPEYRIAFVTLNTVNNSTNAIAISEIKITGTYQNISDNPYSLCREKK